MDKFRLLQKINRAGKRFHLVFLTDLFNLLVRGVLPQMKIRMMPKEARAILNRLSPDPASTSIWDNSLLPYRYDLGIVVPAYNVEQYIGQCIDSILGQKTQYTFRLIIVEDGSTDQTPHLLKKYEQLAGVSVIYQKNQGVSAARNRALQKIDFRYVMFVDSDDYIPENCVERLLSKALAHDADIVEGGYFYVNEEKSLPYLHKDSKKVNASNVFTGYPWGKVIKSTFFKSLCFPQGYWFEDSILTYLIYPVSTKSYTLADPVYFYRMNKDGIVQRSVNHPKSIDSFWVTEQLIKDIKSLELPIGNELYRQLLQEVKVNFLRVQQMDKEVRHALFVLTCDLFERELSTHFADVTDLQDLEKAIRTKDYVRYCMSCCG